MPTKDQITPIGTGWDKRPKGIVPSSVVIHTTSNLKKTSFAHELKYIMSSGGVSYHILIEKNGKVHQILPYELRAWHAGTCLQPFINSHSIGISFHTSVGERVTSSQLAAAAALVRDIVRVYRVVEHRIATHRSVATPPGRKVDPAGLTNEEFIKWRNTVMSTAQANTRVIGTRPSVSIGQFWVWLQKYQAPIEQTVAVRIYTMAEWLDIDPAFVAAVWRHETGQNKGLIGTSDLFDKSFNPGGIIAYGRWPSVTHNKRRFNRYESAQIGLMSLVLHLKQFYGAKGLLDVEDIIPVYAPASDGNAPRSYTNAVLRDMKEMASLPREVV